MNCSEFIRGVHYAVEAAELGPEVQKKSGILGLGDHIASTNVLNARKYGNLR